MQTTTFRTIRTQLQGFARSEARRCQAWRRMLMVGALVIFSAMVVPGCSTGKPASASFASVVIPNRSAEEIRDAAVLVFEEAGYRATRGPAGSMIFEREGSRGDQIVYGGIGGAAYGGAVTVRVRAEIVDLVGQDARRLQCTAYIVNDAGDGIFEDTQRLANFRRGPYQKLLDQVAAKLK